MTTATTRSPGAHGRGFWYVAIGFFVLLAFGTAPTPLWPLFEAHDGFGTTVVTVAFAIMVVGAALSFLTFGHLSDRLGRRRIIVPALLVGIAADVVLVAWQSLPGLMTGRFLTGVAVGLMASTATAYLSDLYAEAHPGRGPSATPGLVAAASNLGGLAMGPLVAGVVAQWLPAPLTVTFIVFGGAMIVITALAILSPETIDHTARSAVRPSRVEFVQGGRSRFVVGAALGSIAFAVMGLYSALGAIIIGQTLGLHEPLVVASAPFAVFAASAVAQLALGARRLSTFVTLGAILLPAGLVLTAITLYLPTLWLFLVAGALAGAGAGLLFKAGLTLCVSSAVPRARAGVLAVYFAISYLGMGIPSILFSVATQLVSMQSAMIGFAVIFVAGVIAVLLVQRSQNRRSVPRWEA